MSLIVVTLSFFGSGGLSMDDAFDERCGDDDGGAMCPICRGEELPPKFIAAMLRAESAGPVVRMTADEAAEWLRGF